MEIIKMEIGRLANDPNNARRHPEKNLKAIKGSLAKFGQQKPIVIDAKHVVIAGNGTLEAAKELGWTHINVVVTELDELGKMAFALADNKTSELAEWDDDILKYQLDWLDKQDFDISDIGFMDYELPGESKGTDGLTDPDEVPEVPQNVFGVKRGDIWLLGNHRLMCGDSTSEDDVKKLMDGKKADMVFTSPPYNAATKVGDGDIFNGKKTKKLYSNNGYSDDLKSNDYIKFAKQVLDICFLFTDGFIFWNVSYNANSRFEYISQITHKLSNLLEQICWKKSSTIPFKGSLMRDWEPIYLFSTDGRKLGLDNVVSNHWTINNTDSQQKDHKACFPVALPEKAILLVKKTSGIVLEPFCGSGSTLIACEKTGRTCYGMELDEHYCSVIIKRWQDFTGKTAIKEV
jgi:DNA modification methylase